MVDIATGLAVKAGAGWLLGQFKKHVIDRWTRRRAEAFFETFVARVAAVEGERRPLRDLEPLLAQMLEDEMKSETMFEAYRRVCLSASKELGPRIIAVITAQLVTQCRRATSEEERLLMVAETFGDKDLVDLAEFLGTKRVEDHKVKMFDEQEDSNWSGGSVILSPVNLGEYVGNWCLKLAACGLVTQDIAKKVGHYDEDSERYIDQPGTLTTYMWTLVFQPEVLELKSLIEGLRAGTENESATPA